MCKIEQSLKPLTRYCVSVRKLDTRSWVSVVNPTFGPSRPRCCTATQPARFRPDSHGSGFFPWPWTNLKEAAGSPKGQGRRHGSQVESNRRRVTFHIVTEQHLRSSARSSHLIQSTHRIFALQPLSDLNGQALSHKFLLGARTRGTAAEGGSFTGLHPTQSSRSFRAGSSPVSELLRPFVHCWHV